MPTDPAAIAASDNLDALHAAWVAKRQAALAEFCEGLLHEAPAWIARAVADDGEAGRGRLLAALATTAAVCAHDHALAAEGYFVLADASSVNHEPQPASRLWYECSLRHAEAAGLALPASRAAYCLGIIEVNGNQADAARVFFGKALEHAEQADHAAGKAAARYRLALLAMAQDQLKEASEQVLASYVLSREAGQYIQAAETCAAWFVFLARRGLDVLADDLALDLLSLFVTALTQALSREDGQEAGDKDAAMKIGAAALRAIAPLAKDRRGEIVKRCSERFGTEMATALATQLDAVVAQLTAEVAPASP